MHIIKIVAQEERFRDLFRLLHWTAKAVNLHFKTLYSCGLWMTESSARVAIEAGFKMMDA